MDPKRKRLSLDVGLDADRSAAFTAKVQEDEGFAATSMDMMNQYRKSGILCDVKLVAKWYPSYARIVLDNERGPEIPAHRCVLAMRSDYFKAMFTNGMSETKQDVITINGIRHDTLTQVVEFLYKGSCQVSKDEAKYLTCAATMLQIPSLMKSCEENLHRSLGISNIFKMYSLADSYHMPNILAKCEEFIPNHLGVLIKQEEFYKLPAAMIHAILKLPKVNLGPNHDHRPLREALQSWVMLNRKNEIDKLKKHVELEKLTLNFHLQLDKASQEGMMEDVPDKSKITSLPDCFSLIAVMGGLRGYQGSQCPTMEIFDTHSLTWQSKVQIRSKSRPVLVRTVFKSDGMFYFLSMMNTLNADVFLYEYQPAISQWSMVRKIDSEEAIWKLANSTRHVRAVAENGHELFLCGAVSKGAATKRAYKVDAKRNTIKELPHLPFEGYSHSVVVVGEDLYIIGGNSLSCMPRKSVFRLRNGHSEWEEVSSMLKPRAGAGLAVLGGFIYVVGGYDHGKRFNSVERYHIASDRWQYIQEMHHHRTYPGVVAAGGCLYVFGGKATSSCEKFDPSTNKWVELPPMEDDRFQMVTMTV